MAKELSTDGKESLNDRDSIKLVTLMLGVHGHVFPKISAQNIPFPAPHSQLFVFESGKHTNSKVERRCNLLITLRRFYLRKWQTHNFERNLETELEQNSCYV